MRQLSGGGARRRGGAIALGIAVISAGDPAYSASAVPQSGDATVFAGHSNLTEGFDDRNYVTGFANVRYESGLGLHLESVGEWREEDAGFFAGGASWNTDSTSIKGMLGTSSYNLDILPEFYARAEAVMRSDPAKGYVFATGLTYRSYRNTADLASLDAGAVRYFDLGGDRQLIGQLFAEGAFSNPGSNLGGQVGGDVTYLEYLSWSAGVTVEGDQSNYDSVVGAGGVSNSFFSVRPHVAVFVAERVELILRGEYYNTELYDILGASVGVSVSFGGS